MSHLHSPNSASNFLEKAQLQHSSSAMPSYGEYDENGVDLSLLRYTLSLTPLQRLIQMEKHARDVLRLNDYGRRHRETKTGSDR